MPAAPLVGISLAVLVVVVTFLVGERLVGDRLTDHDIAPEAATAAVESVSVEASVSTAAVESVSTEAVEAVESVSTEASPPAASTSASDVSTADKTLPASPDTIEPASTAATTLVTEPSTLPESTAVVSTEAAGTSSATIPLSSLGGFRPFNNPEIVLADGRIVVRGQWGSDETFEVWSKPFSEPDQPEPQPTISHRRPVRLFVYNPVNGSLKTISHWPQVHRYSTAVSEGTYVEAVLNIEVLPGEKSVRYSVGFNGAGYDVVDSWHDAPIPPSG